MRDYLRKLWRLFSSLKLAVILLIAVSAASLLGTLFPQLPPEVAGDPQASARWLTMAREKYGTLAGLYDTLGLFNIYRSPGFALLITTLIFNTLVCTIRRFKATWQMLTEQREGVSDLFVDRHRRVRLGTLITHLSVVLVVLGFVWSHGWGWRERAVALGPGQLYPVGHGHSFLVRCDGFEVERYPSGLPKDYRAHLTVLEADSEVVSKVVRVNAPLSYQGVGFYLSSYGPAAKVRARDAMGNPLPVQVMGEEISQGEAVLNFAGEGEGWDLLIPTLDLHLQVVFHYEGPSLFVQAIRSGQAIFADFVHDGEAVELADARFEFTLVRHVVLQVVSDPGFKVVIAAAFLVLVGLILSLCAQSPKSDES